jgi:Tol biopolymer transport system component
VPGNNAINSKPSWSLDDKTIYFHRAGGGVKGGFQIWAIDANGTHLRQLTFRSEGLNEYPGT